MGRQVEFPGVEKSSISAELMPLFLSQFVSRVSKLSNVSAVYFTSINFLFQDMACPGFTGRLLYNAQPGVDLFGSEQDAFTALHSALLSLLPMQRVSTFAPLLPVQC